LDREVMEGMTMNGDETVATSRRDSLLAEFKRRELLITEAGENEMFYRSIDTNGQWLPVADWPYWSLVRECGYGDAVEDPNSAEFQIMLKDIYGAPGGSV
jgi:hypothetical protein